MAGRGASESVAEGGAGYFVDVVNSFLFVLGTNGRMQPVVMAPKNLAGYFVENGQIAETSSFFRPFLNCLPNPAFAIVISDFPNFGAARDVVNYVENGWFELWVMRASG